MVKAKTFKKTIKIPSGYKVIKTSLTPSASYTVKKGLLGKKILKKIVLPKGSNPMEIFYRKYNNTINVKYIK